MKILISAYTCNPTLGSESGVGWGWTSTIAREHEVWVITDVAHQPAIETFLAANPNPRLHFCYIPKTPFFRFTERHFQLLPLLAWRAYLCWQKDAFALGMKLHQTVCFDLVHNLTYVGFRAPGLWWKADIPFVWGPLGGLEQTNLRLAWALGARCFLWYLCRNILNWRDKVFCQRVKHAMKKAAGRIISATPAIQREIKKYYHQDSTVISEIGIPESAVESENFTPCERRDGEALRLIWIGRMIPGKGFPFVIQALQKCSTEVRWELDVFGDGICRKQWEKLANRAGLGAKIRWHGNRPRTEVQSAFQQAHALLISSIYELTCTVAVEALTAGVPAVAPDICGFSSSVPDACGIRFPAATPAQFVAGLRAGIETLHRDEPARQAMAQHARTHAATFSWTQTLEKTNRLYGKIATARSHPQG